MRVQRVVCMVQPHRAHSHAHGAHLVQVRQMQRRFEFRLGVHQQAGHGLGTVVLRVGHHQRLAVQRHRSVFGLLLLFTVLGATVLEPDLDLPLGQLQRLGQFGLSPDGDVSRVVEFFLQLESLLVCVHDPVFVLGAGFPCERKRDGKDVELQA